MNLRMLLSNYIYLRQILKVKLCGKTCLNALYPVNTNRLLIAYRIAIPLFLKKSQSGFMALAPAARNYNSLQLASILQVFRQVVVTPAIGLTVMQNGRILIITKLINLYNLLLRAVYSKNTALDRVNEVSLPD